MRDETFSQLSAAGKSHSRKSCAPTRAEPTPRPALLQIALLWERIFWAPTGARYFCTTRLLNSKSSTKVSPSSRSSTLWTRIKAARRTASLPSTLAKSSSVC